MTNGRKMVVFLRDSIFDKVELRKGNEINTKDYDFEETGRQVVAVS